MSLLRTLWQGTGIFGACEVPIDEVPFSPQCMPDILHSAWHLKDSISVVEKHGHCYILKFNNAVDIKVVKDNSPWAVKNKLLFVDSWSPNLDLENHQVLSFPIWVQIWGLPLEYLSEDAAITLGTLMVPCMQLIFKIKVFRISVICGFVFRLKLFSH